MFGQYTPQYTPNYMGGGQYQTALPQTMQQNQPAMQATQPAQQNMQGLSVASRLVTNREEAMGVPADFSGALMVFPDISHSRVFVKRWNYGTGAADFIEFAPVQPVQPEVEFVPLGDYTNTVNGLQDKIDKLTEEIERLKKPSGKAVKKNDSDE